MPKRTPFYEKHVAAGAKLTNFGGYEMPISYKGIKVEHRAVREHVGLFDVSHMGEFLIEGPEALNLVQWVITNDASKLDTGKALYTVMCYPNGGIVDDLLVYKLSEQRYMLVVNAANIDKDLSWINKQNRFDADVKDQSDHMCLLAIQGPKSVETLQKLSSLNLSEISYYRFEVGRLADFDNIIISRTGYTGEVGFELYFDKNETEPEAIWDAILTAGREHNLEPAGLGARDSLRLEMGLALYGNDIDEDTNPYEAKLNWLVKLNKSNFVGRKALQDIYNQGVSRVLTGLSMCNTKKIPRKNYLLYNPDGNNVGRVTSGGYSISLEKGIGMAYVKRDYAENHKNIMVEVRGKNYEATLEQPPFIKKKK